MKNQKNKRYVLYGVMLATLLPSIFLVRLPSISSFKTYELYFSAILGYLGVGFLLWMYILGSRSLLRLGFTNYQPLIKVHNWLGKYGTVLIFLHPLLITLSYGEKLFYSFIPSSSTRFEAHVTLGRISFWILLLVWLTSAIIRSKIAYRPWKYLHYLAYLTVPFALLHVPDTGSNFMNSSALKAYYFLWLIVLLVVTFLRLRSWLNLDATTYEVVNQKQLTDQIFMLQLSPSGNTKIKIEKGQYIYVKLGYLSEDHPFSVLQYDEPSGDITIAYKVFGNYTELMSELTTSQQVYVSGPFGSFTEEIIEDQKPIVFIAGGIGVTPFIDHILRPEHPEQSKWLFYANKSHDSGAFIDLMQNKLGSNFVPVFSRPEKPIAANEVAGHISTQLITDKLQKPTDYQYYMCGSSSFMEDVTVMLLNLGVNSSSIRTEEFSF